MPGLFRTFIIAIVAVYFLPVILFNSFTQPILVMIAIPFGIIGVIAAFGFHGEPLSFMAIMGVVGLSGVVVNDSLVLFDHINAPMALALGWGAVAGHSVDLGTGALSVCCWPGHWSAGPTQSETCMNAPVEITLHEHNDDEFKCRSFFGFAGGALLYNIDLWIC